MANLLIVDDEKDFCKLLSNFLKNEGYEVLVSYNGESAVKTLEENSVDAVLLDLKIPDISGITLLTKIKNLDEDLPVIILTGHADVKSAVKAMKIGAFDYLSKPVDEEELLVVINKALKTKNISEEIKVLRQFVGTNKSVEFIDGKSIAAKDLMKQIKSVAPTDMTVLLYGESGTGKEVIARLIHNFSLRREKPFVVIDCGTLPENLVESELFGYEKGAFTGANQQKLGYCELAHGGSLFLDEIGNLNLSTQAKLLRLIQEKTFFHLGGKKEIKVDVRIIAATNIQLEEAVKERKFREDLFHRLNEFSIRAPLLKERAEDIPILVEYFLQDANKELKKDVKSLSSEVMELFKNYSWPGNIRELKNIIKRAVLLAEDVILPKHIQFAENSHTETPPDSSKSFTIKEATSEMEKKLILEALEKTRYRKTKAAKLLGIDRVTLYYRMKKYNIK